MTRSEGSRVGKCSYELRRLMACFRRALTVMESFLWPDVAGVARKLLHCACARSADEGEDKPGGCTVIHFLSRDQSVFRLNVSHRLWRDHCCVLSFDVFCCCLFFVRA